MSMQEMTAVISRFQAVRPMRWPRWARGWE